MSGHDLKNHRLPDSQISLVPKSEFDAIVQIANDAVARVVQRAMDAEKRAQRAEESLHKTAIEIGWRDTAFELEKRLALYESVLKDIRNIAEYCLGATEANLLCDALAARGLNVRLWLTISPPPSTPPPSAPRTTPAATPSASKTKTPTPFAV